MPITVCPKCTYERTSSDHAPAWQCPRCGVAYNKVHSESPEAPRGVAHVPGKLRSAPEAKRSANELESVIEPPTLTTINGCGFMLLGKSKVDRRDGSYMATYFLVICFFPVLPLARYRVIRDGEIYGFVGKGRLRIFEWAYLGAVIALLAMLYFKGRAT